MNKQQAIISDAIKDSKYYIRDWLNLELLLKKKKNYLYTIIEIVKKNKQSFIKLIQSFRFKKAMNSKFL